jgi:hypothetical protein
MMSERIDEIVKKEDVSDRWGKVKDMYEDVKLE